jgi:soluble lytic murein transglycosylase
VHRKAGPVYIARMFQPIRLLSAVLLLGFARPAGAAEMPAIAPAHWVEAAKLAEGVADPVAQKLATYFRLLTPGAASAEEIAAFMAQNPEWPNQGLLERRREEAISAQPDIALVVGPCLQGPITLPGTLARCADALADAGNPDAAAAEASKAWVDGYADPAGLPNFLKRWSAALTPADQWDRFRHLAWSDPAAAARQISLLPKPLRPAAKARLALIHGAADAARLVHALPAAEQEEPGLVLDEARWLRRNNHDADALTLWRERGFAAEAADPEHRSAFWAERSLLARELLKEHDDQGAEDMADDLMVTAPGDVVDMTFLAGFIALTRLNDPGAATLLFQQLADASKAAITQGRAHYWLARAAAAAGADPRPEYEKAAAYPTTFYGQLAARALGEDPTTLLAAAHDPAYTRDQAWNFTANELVRAAVILLAWGEPGRARAFLLRMQEVAPDEVEQALAARLALAMDMPDAAVAIARRMGAEGRMLPRDGWPMAVDPPHASAAGGVDPAVTLAVIRQESSFDHAVVSPAGALGLMQLMPATASLVARQLGDPSVTQVSLLTDPAQNMQLGGAYMQGLLAQFGGCLPLAVAAYNAGPGRVMQWLVQYGDPRTGQIDMVDWIELIPFNETRNYVERVLENVVIYRARRHEGDTTLLAQWSQ